MSIVLSINTLGVSMGMKQFHSPGFAESMKSTAGGSPLGALGTFSGFPLRKSKIIRLI